MTSPRPTLQWIHISLLRIDPLVQRATDPNRAAALGQKWNIDAVGNLIVNHRNDRLYYIVDGGHRYGAAISIGFDGKLPCLVHEQLSLDKEAELFLALNDSKLVQAIDKFRVRIVAREKVATLINEALDRYGWRVGGGQSSGCFAAVTALEKVFNGAGVLKDEHPELVDAVLFTIVKAWGHDSAGAHATIVGGLGQLFARFGSEVDIHKLSKEMAKVRPVDLTSRARQLKDNQGGTAPAAAAKIMVGLHNKALRSNRLPDWRWTR